MGLLAHSTSVVATGFEFAGDVLASSIVLIGMGVAARPADDNHPYGHGRFETLSAFIVGVILVVGGAMISLSVPAGHRRAPRSAADWRAVLALVGAIVLRGVMSSMKFRVGRRLRSAALVADARNDAVDILVGARRARGRRRSPRTTPFAFWPPITTAASSSDWWS